MAGVSFVAISYGGNPKYLGSFAPWHHGLSQFLLVAVVEFYSLLSQLLPLQFLSKT